MLDTNGRVIEDGPEPKPVLPGEKRTFRVWLDCNQYRMDMESSNKGSEVNQFLRVISYKTFVNKETIIHFN